jgi:nucleoid-associated protein YgaU
VLKSAEVTYVMFEPDGHPLRAKVKATFSENIEDTLRVAEERKSSPDLTHVHTVKAGEHLSLLAHRYYGDPSRYFQVAQYNGLTNYRRLVPGQRLEFPPINDAPSGSGG